jgi:hypothetical protein
MTNDPAQGFVSRHRFVLLFAALLAFFVLVPIVHQVHAGPNPALPSLIEAALFIAVLAAVVVALSNTRTSKLLAVVFGLIIALLVLIHAFVDFFWLVIVRHFLGAAFLGYAIVAMLRLILSSPRITTNVVFASLCIYLLLGVMWALGYSMIEAFDPGAFWSSLPAEQTLPLMLAGKGKSSPVLYFSYATLTSLGYGDIVPVSPIARTLATLEAITGQLYLAVLVARLVGLHVAGSINQSEQTGTPRSEK